MFKNFSSFSPILWEVWSKAITENHQESRREWLLQQFGVAANSSLMFPIISSGAMIIGLLSFRAIKSLMKREHTFITILWKLDWFIGLKNMCFVVLKIMPVSFDNVIVVK